MSINLAGLSAKQLGSLIKQATQQRAIVAKRVPVTKVKAQLKRLAKSQGYTLEELFGGTEAVAAPTKKAVRKLGKVPPKYQNPANAKDTWTGRGRAPVWLAELLSKGHQKDEFLIKKAATGKKAATAKKAGVRKPAGRKAAAKKAPAKN